MKISTGEHYLAFVLTPACRAKLFARIAPQFGVIKCDHVTVAYSFQEEHIPALQALVDSNPIFYVFSYIQADGIELFEVCADVTVDRILGGRYHLTCSRAEERSSSDSNAVLSGAIPAQKKLPMNCTQLEGEFQLIPY